MHAVIRKRQGLPWEPEGPKGLLKNSIHLTNVSALPNFEPIPQDELRVAHGAIAYTKLVADVGSPLLALRQRALAKIVEMLVAPRHIASFLNARIVPALNVAGSDADTEVRYLTTLAFGKIAKEEKGRQELIDHDTPPVLLKLADDSELAVRSNSLDVVAILGRSADGMRALIKTGFVKVIVDRCRRAIDGGPPNPVVQIAALTALRQFCQVDAGCAEALGCEAIEATVFMLTHGNDEMRVQAAYCLAALTAEQQTKSLALKEGIMEPLVMMLHPSMDTSVKTASAAALMSMTNGTRFPNGENACKSAAVNAGAIDALIPLLQDGLQLEIAKKMDHTNSALTVYVFKCMSNMADAPKGRKQLQQVIGDLETLSQSSDPLVRKHALIAIERVTWKP